MPTKRKSYKTLYMGALSAASGWKDKADQRGRELGRLRVILAEHARTETIPEIEAHIKAHTGPVPLYPLSYEAVRASLMTNVRFAPDYDDLASGFERNIIWRNRPLVCTP